MGRILPRLQRLSRQHTYQELLESSFSDRQNNTELVPSISLPKCFPSVPRSRDAGKITSSSRAAYQKNFIDPPQCIGHEPFSHHQSFQIVVPRSVALCGSHFEERPPRRRRNVRWGFLKYRWSIRECGMVGVRVVEDIRRLRDYNNSRRRLRYCVVFVRVEYLYRSNIS
jgi:hypothetical protein